jgi:hypothetical protein
VRGIWIPHITIPFSVSGGREEGYRGYTYITARTPGEYRCNIETDDGVLIGRRSVKTKQGTATLKKASF